MAVVPKQNAVEILRKLIPLNTLPAENLDRLFDAAVFKKLYKGDSVFKEGDENRERIYLLSGSITIRSGKNEVDAINAGGKMARYPIAHQSPRKFSVIARTKIETVSIDNDFLADMFASVEDKAYEVSSFEEQIVDDDWMNQLLQSRVFQQIPATNIQNVMMRMEEMKTLAGDVVISQGDEGDYFYLINKGECLVSLSEDGGESKEVARLGPGESFGEDALLSDKPRGSTVTMLTNGTLIRLGKQDFVDYVKRPLAGAISYEEALERAEQGATWLDVRPTADHLAGRVPGSISIPFNRLRRRFGELDSEQSYIVYCNNGQVSTTAAYLLLDQGIGASILKGGLNAVDNDFLEAAGSDEGAEIIQLHQDQGGGQPPPVEGSKEIELLKARLTRMEGIAKEQNLMARKLKAVLDQTKEKLADAENRNNSSGDVKHRLEEELAQSREKLKQQQQQLEEEKGELVSQLGALKEAQEALQEQLASAKEESESLSNELAQRQQSGDKQQRQQEEEKNELASQFGALKKAQEALQEQLASAKEESEGLNNELAQRQQSGDQQQQQLEEEKIELVSQLAARKEAQDELQGQLTSASEESEGLRSELTQRQQSGEQQQQQLEEEKSELVSQLGALKEAQEELQEQLMSASEESEGLRSKLNQRQQNGDQQQQQQEEEKSELASQLASLSETHEVLKEQLTSASEESEGLRSKLNQRQQSGDQQQQSLEEEKSELVSQLGALKEAQEALQEQLALAKEESEGLRSKLNQRQQSGDQQQQQLEEEKSELASQLGALKEAQEALQEQLALAKEESEGLSNELTQRQQSGDQQQQQLEEEKIELASQLATLSETHEVLKEQLTSASEESEGLRSKLNQRQQSGDQQQQQLEEEKSELASQLGALKEAQEALQEQLALAKEESEGLSNELTQRQQSGDQQQQQLEEEKIELASQLATLSETHEVLKEQLTSASEESEGLRSKLNQRQQSGDQQQQQLEEEKSELVSQLATLNEERGELRSELNKSESAVADRKKQIDIQQKELDRSEIDKKDLTALADGLKEKLHGWKAERNSLRLELKRLEEALEQVAEQTSGKASTESVLQSQLDELSEEKEMVEQEARRLNGEVDELRSVMEQYAEQIQEAQQEVGGEEVAALREELKLVRQQAEEDVVQLRQTLEATQAEDASRLAASEGSDAAEQMVMLQLELEEVREKIREGELTGSVDATESEAIRQEMDSLQRSLDERRRELDMSRKDSLLLEEKIEERNSEVDRLKLALDAALGEMDEAAFSRDEAVEAKKQVEDALYKVQEKVDSERPVEGLEDSRLVGGAKQVLDIESGSSVKSILVSGLVGAAAAFGLVELFSIMSGGGEIVGRILQQEIAPVQVEAPVTVPLKPVEKRITAPRQVVVVPPVQEAPQPSLTSPGEKQPPKPTEAAADKPLAVEDREPASGTVIQDRLNSGGRAPEMAYIRGGEFIMGSDRSQLASEERPSHRVGLKSYAIGRYEVTFDEYSQFAKATGRSLPDDLGWGRGRRPVMNVSWEDASTYTVWLSRKTNKKYRLPTEAEWEYAAAAGNDTTYWWGFQIGKNRANCFNCGSRWDRKSTAPIGGFEPNLYGLYNTAGNVMEWVADCYHNNYRGAPSNGGAWIDPGCRERVVRGGAFNKPGESLRTTKRSHHGADSKLFAVGFRLARDL